MPATTVRAWTNIQLPTTTIDAPYFIPDATGIPVPAGKTSWDLKVDQANVPAGQLYGFHIEFQIDGAWVPDAGSDEFVGGPVSVLHSSATTTINELGSSIGSTGPNGQRIGSYPTNIRVQVTRMNHAWIFPTISLVMT